MTDYEAFRRRAEGKRDKFRQTLARLKKAPDSTVDSLFQSKHERVFADTDCLSCAYCCRFVGPRWTRQDIKRASAALHMKEAEFETKYLRIDEDHDFVFQTMPCPFLGSDNYCSIYGDRPKACREFPHTDRKKIKQLFNLTLVNSTCCPAVEKILDELS